MTTKEYIQNQSNVSLCRDAHIFVDGRRTDSIFLNHIISRIQDDNFDIIGKHVYVRGNQHDQNIDPNIIYRFSDVMQLTASMITDICSCAMNDSTSTNLIVIVTNDKNLIPLMTMLMNNKRNILHIPVSE